MRSLSARLLLSISVLLLVFFTLTALVLDRIFRNAAEESTAALLEIQRNSLITVIDFDATQQLILPDFLSEPRLNNPGSGLLAFIARTELEPTTGQLKNTMLWKSTSAVGVVEPTIPILAVGSSHLQQSEYAGEAYYQASFAIDWETNAQDANGQETDTLEQQQLVITVAQSLEPYLEQLANFRRQLFSWFAVLMAVLLVAIGFLMRWILQPLRRIEDEVGEIDAGKRNLLSDDYPSELLGVTRNTNALIRAERSRLERYRNTLGNLAHSLKTPLAVIKTSVEKAEIDTQVIQAQVMQMNEIVGYQLKRAVTAGSSTLGHEPVSVNELLQGLKAAMQKVHHTKAIDFIIAVDKNLLFHGDKGDLTELFGNLMDNASKWCKKKVRIRTKSLAADKERAGLQFTIEDDGGGIAQDVRDRILKRGQRADESIPGHGIGLAIVKEIVLSYQGVLEISDSDLGGAKFVIRLPAV